VDAALTDPHGGWKHRCQAVANIAALDKPIARAEDFMLLAEAAKRDGLA
jgi:hypothetical protein